MRYTMKSGVLYRDQRPLMKIRSSLTGSVKRISDSEETLLFQTDIQDLRDKQCPAGDGRCRRYILTDRDEKLLAEAFPGYAQGEDLACSGWPVFRMPRVDHAQVSVGSTGYCLRMHNSMCYTLTDEAGIEVLRILHQGIIGGWTLEDSTGLSAGILCGLFIFCRYIELENELISV